MCTITSITRVIPVARALLQPRRASRLLVTRSHGLYINLVVRRDYSSPGRTSSTSTSPCAASTCLLAAVGLPQLRRTTGCIGSHTARPGSSARRTARCAARRRLLLPRRASRCLDTSRGSSRGLSSPTSPIMCDRVPRHIARLLARHVTWLLVDYFSYVARPSASARRVARRRLLRLRRASGCHDTSCGSSRGSSSTTWPMLCDRVPRHVARLVIDHAPSRRSTSRRLVTLALTVRPLTTSRGATTRRSDCTGSTAPMSCIRTRHLDARLLISRSHWLSPCARSFRCAL
jgi:hypothetical protein